MITMWHRRAFIKASALTMFASTLGGTPLFLTRAARAAGTHNQPFKRRKTLVCIFQRGAMDGVMAVQPYEDPHLKQVRPDLFSSAAKSAGTAALKVLDGRFGLHPTLSPLLPYYQDGRLAVVHGIGSPVANRSHFDAQDYMETGTPGKKGTPSGWLNRATGLLGHEGTPFQSVAMTSALPRSLYGEEYALAVEHLENLSVGVSGMSPHQSGDARQGFEALYRQTTQKMLKDAGSVSLDAARLLKEKNITAMPPRSGVQYPNSSLGQSLQQIAQLIKGGVGLEIAFAESAGWDTHARQSGRFGGFNLQADDLSTCIAAFWQDIERYQDDVVLMTMTEFGRTIAQNGSLGTDHGRASCMFVLGNAVKGGQVYGDVPELAPENLAEGRDLPVTTDFRSLFAGVAGAHLDIAEDAVLFPGWRGERMPLVR